MTLRCGILALLLLASVGGSFAQGEATVATRFGSLDIGVNKELLFRDHPLKPSIVGNSGIDIGSPIQVSDSDIALVTNIGGTACPFLYYFVTVSKSGARATKAFGTCNEATDIKKVGVTVRVTMNGFLGPFEPAAARKKAFREVHVFVFQSGLVKEEKPSSK